MKRPIPRPATPASTADPARTASTIPVGTTAAPQRLSTRIAEIDGLRGLALTLVVVFHLFGNGRVSGGVDVFLVVSGFLLSRSLIKRMGPPGAPWMLRHYGRVLMRLVPSALLVLAAVTVATFTLASPTRWMQNTRELIASALYYENWELIDSQLAYGAAGPDTSPLQHFWSLSVQGQFFLFWPLAIVAIVLVSRRFTASALRVVVVVTAAATAASFAYAVYLVGVDQPVAYFSTWSRFWELGAGALLAFAMHRFDLPDRAKAPLGWLGLAMIVSCGFLIDGGAVFPGVATLWPVAGTALVIVAAGDAAARGPRRLLETRPLKFFAGISYPLYLWHWPLLIFYIGYQGYEGVGWRGALIVFSISVVLAWLTQRFVADPALDWSPKLSPRIGLAVPVAAVAIFALALTTSQFLQQRELEVQLLAASQVSPDHPGAMALVDGTEPENPDAPFTPSIEAAFPDLPALYAQRCLQSPRTGPGMDEVLVCRDGTTRPSKTIVMSGGSHVTHWYGAMKLIAPRYHWAVHVVDKGACRLTTRLGDDALTESCHSWNDKAFDVIVGLRPDALFTVATKTPEDDGPEISYPGQVDVWGDFDEAGVPTIAVRDTPRFTSEIPPCVEAHLDDPTACSRARADIFADEAPVLADPALPDSTVLLDLTDAFCGPVMCDPIVGNVLVYRDADHFTATYSRTLAPILERQLRERAPWLFD